MHDYTGITHRFPPRRDGPLARSRYASTRAAITPPCIRHLVLPFTAGDWQGFPLRVRAPHRGAWRKGKGSRVVRCKGLSAIFLSSPPPGWVVTLPTIPTSGRLDNS
jgi:hypothetical protein